MKDEHLDILVKSIISSTANSLPPDSHIKAVHKNGETWFCFMITAERGGTIKGCINPRQGVSALVRRLLESDETASGRQFVLTHGESVLRQLLADLPQDVADFTHSILNKAQSLAIQKGSTKLARNLRLADPQGLLAKVEELADHTKPMQDLGKWLFDLQLQREKTTTGRKGSKLTRSETIEAGMEYRQIHARFREIKKDQTQEQRDYKKRPEIKRLGFKPTAWKKEWRKICERRVRYHDLPKNILALFVDESPSNIAALFVSRRFSISDSYLKTGILPLAKKLQK